MPFVLVFLLVLVAFVGLVLWAIFGRK